MGALATFIIRVFTMRQLININPTSMHGIYLRLVVSNGAGL
jgi:hypothetical protein